MSLGGVIFSLLFESQHVQPVTHEMKDLCRSEIA